VTTKCLVLVLNSAFCLGCAAVRNLQPAQPALRMAPPPHLKAPVLPSDQPPAIPEMIPHRVIALSSNPRRANVPVAPGDTIVVSKAGIVYVVGDVHKPGGFIMENGNNMTVLQAIAMAEGNNPTASLDHARLIRKTPRGQQEIPINLKKILSSEAPDMKLEAEDITLNRIRAKFCDLPSNRVSLCLFGVPRTRPPVLGSISFMT